MNANKADSPEHKAERERHKTLTDQQIDELERAGGVEGGMQAGSAGGPGQGDAEAEFKEAPREPAGKRAGR